MTDMEKEKRHPEGIHDYEEYKNIPQVLAWIIIIILSVSIMSGAMMLMFIIPDVDREWDFGALPQTPGESIYSTQEPEDYEAENVPLQIEPLPGAKPTLIEDEL